MLGGEAPSQPPGWNKIFDSPDIGPFTEKWQLWQNASGSYAIVLRGTVLDAGSILEDLISFLVPAIGRVTVGPIQIDYSFAASSEASVHFGFALGTLLLLKDPKDGILVQLASRVPAGSQIYITGHSQGAAMATLLRSYLAYAFDAPTNKNYSYKTYVYAQPKPGNDHYAEDFENTFCNSGLAFRVTNSLDWVPQVPFTIESPHDINTPNPDDGNERREVALFCVCSCDLDPGMAKCPSRFLFFVCSSGQHHTECSQVGKLAALGALYQSANLPSGFH
jgi:Lipase (class 3)